jgi:hypothetical protein
MDTNEQIKILQLAYAGALVDAALQLSKEGVFEKVISRKRLEQIAGGSMRAAQFGITEPEAVFRKLSEIFGCANWEIIQEKGGGFTAQTTSCKMCTIAKKVGAPSPCHLYCLDPMEGLIKAVKEGATYTVEETLWDGQKCSVKVT